MLVRMKLRTLLAAAWLLVTLSSHAGELTGKQIIQNVLAGFPQKDFLCQARLTFPDSAGKETILDVQIQTRNRPEAIQLAVVVINSSPGEEAMLSVCRADGPTELWRNFPLRDKAPARIQGAQLGQSFAGSDFAYEDFGFGFLRWPEHKLGGEKRRQARDCYVIESTPAQGQSAQYGKIISWIDKENSMLLLAEGFAPDGRLLKVFDIRSLKQFEGGWFIKTMNLKNVAANRQTKLGVTQFEYAANLDDRYFSPQSFGRVAAFKFPQGTKNF